MKNNKLNLKVRVCELKGLQQQQKQQHHRELDHFVE